MSTSSFSVTGERTVNEEGLLQNLYEYLLVIVRIEIDGIAKILALPNDDARYHRTWLGRNVTTRRPSRWCEKFDEGV